MALLSILMVKSLGFTSKNPTEKVVTFFNLSSAMNINLYIYIKSVKMSNLKKLHQIKNKVKQIELFSVIIDRILY